MTGSTTLSCIALLALAAATRAQPLPGTLPIEDPRNFVTVGAPGNPAFRSQRDPGSGSEGRGSLDYTFNIARTELTVSQWIDFANAYLPYATGGPQNVWLRGGGYLSYDAVNRRYSMTPGAERTAIETSWELAARYCNWLTNDRRSDAAAFQTGAYDTSTFYSIPGVGPQHNTSRLPTARYWIPSSSEWLKATYYDPNRFGPNAGGWWLAPTSSDVRPISGLPEDGGQTSRGIDWLALPVGSYPTVQSPWGLLDVSGSVREWTSGNLPNLVRIAGSSSFSSDVLQELPEYAFIGGAPDLSLAGVRIATVPSANSGVVLVMASLLTLRRRRSRHRSSQAGKR